MNNYKTSRKNNINNKFSSEVAKYGIAIGIYDDNEILKEERIIPLGNYLTDQLPTTEEIVMTKFLSATVNQKAS